MADMKRIAKKNIAGQVTYDNEYGDVLFEVTVSKNLNEVDESNERIVQIIMEMTNEVVLLDRIIGEDWGMEFDDQVQPELEDSIYDIIVNYVDQKIIWEAEELAIRENLRDIEDQRDFTL
jgi:predicted butyrate kinase (DUF1464 family)